MIPKNNWGSWDESLKLFESGKLAIVSSSGSSLSRIKDEAPDIYKTIAVSKPLTGATGLSRNPLMNLVVPSKSENQKEAIKFANYITNDENQLAFCKKVSIFLLQQRQVRILTLPLIQTHWRDRQVLCQQKQARLQKISHLVLPISRTFRMQLIKFIRHAL